MAKLSGKTDRRRHGLETARIELLDPFGSVVAEGYLTPKDIPGIDVHTPSAADEFARRFRGQRVTLDGDGPPWSIRVS